MDVMVKVFELKREAKPDEKPTELLSFAVSGETAEDARRAAAARLEAEGRNVRSLSFLADGGLAAVVFPPTPKPTQKPRSKRRRGEH